MKKVKQIILIAIVYILAFLLVENDKFIQENFQMIVITGSFIFLTILFVGLIFWIRRNTVNLDVDNVNYIDSANSTQNLQMKSYFNNNN